MNGDLRLQLTLWLVTHNSTSPAAEAFAGDLLESVARGRSQWWCLGQAMLHVAFSIEKRLRALLTPLWYCIAFVFLYPMWQRLYAPGVTHLLTQYRGTIPWPGSAVLEIVAGLLPGVLFVWMGIFYYLLLRRQSLAAANPASVMLSLNVGGCLLCAASVLRLHGLQNDLRLLSRADFYYPIVHARFSVLLFVSLFAAMLALPREGHPQPRQRDVAHSLRRYGVLRLARSLGLIVLLVPQLSAQQYGPRLMGADGKPMEFEVVSVKPDPSGGADMGIASPPMSNGLTISNMPVENMLQWAFGTFVPDEIVGVPGWARQERYDVSAKVSEADVAGFRKVVDPVQRTPMLQKILIDRFNLKFHYEMKDLPVYALVVGKNGIRMEEIQPAVGPNGMKDGGSRQLGRGMIKSMGQPMLPLVHRLSMELHRPIVDRTGLTGFYNYTLRWTPEEGPPQEGDAPSIFTAVQEQLGLKLESVKAPVQVLVIDRLERPTEN